MLNREEIQMKKKSYLLLPQWAKEARIDNMIELRREGRTLQQIGNEWGYTRERVRQILDRAYRERGLEPFDAKKMYDLKRFESDMELIQKVSRWMKRGKTLKETCDKIGVNINHVRVVFARHKDIPIPRYCQRCGELLPSNRSKWCEHCAEFITHYANWTPHRKEWFRNWRLKRRKKKDVIIKRDEMEVVKNA
jgi:hypothetical protein